MSDYRHELKYLVSQTEMLLLQSRISTIMCQDSHVSESGSYRIRSLYFDDFNNRCYYENENGTDPREKFRIRLYQNSTERIVLECKRKERGKTRKISSLLSIEQTEALMHGLLPGTDASPSLLQKMILQMQLQLLHPVVIVEYERIPYVYRNGNVRVTFDVNLSASSDTGEFLSEKITRRPVMPKNLYLMEVKYDEYLPDFIYNALNLKVLQQTAFSKYYICRKLSLREGLR